MASEADKGATGTKKRKHDPIYSRNLGKDMVLITVGSSKEPFSIHKDLLCSKGDYFDKMFNGGFKEATDKTANFPEDNVEAFELFVSWVYTDQISFKSQQTIGFPQLAELFRLAEKYVIPSLQDHIMDYAVRKTDPGPDTNDIALGYKLTSKGSKYRLLMARHYAFAILNYDNSRRGFETLAMHDVARREDELLGDALSMMRGINNRYGGLINPNKYAYCSYHHHSSTEVCPYG